MTHVFLDSSALIKRYVDERGASWIRAATAPDAGNTIVVASFTRVKVVSGIMRLRREGALNEAASQAIRRLVDHHASGDYIAIGLTEAIIEQAEDLLERHPLRASDSVQLASALEAGKRLASKGVTGFLFVSSDSRLLDAAASEALQTIDPSSSR